MKKKTIDSIKKVLGKNKKNKIKGGDYKGRGAIQLTHTYNY